MNYDPKLEIDWVLTEPLYVTLLSAEFGRYLVRDAGARYAVILAFEDESGTDEPERQVLTFNGQFVDLGDDFFQFLGTLDQAAEAGEGVTVYEEAPSE